MKLVIAPLAALGLTACAAPLPPPPPPAPPLGPPPGVALAPALPPGDCFRSSDIRGHTIGDRQTLYLRVRQSEVYRVGMAGSCLAGAISSDPLVMRQPPGSSIVCRPIDLDVGVSRDGMIATTCIVQSIVKLTPEQVAALPRRLRP